MNVEWLLEEAQDYLLSLRENEEEEGESLYLDEEAETVRENLSATLIELSAQYEQLAGEQETLQFQNDELDVQLEQIEAQWSEEYEREVCLQIAQLQQQNRKHVVQVDSRKDQLRKLLATKAELARELEDLRSKGQFFQRKTELNRKSIEKVNKHAVKTLAERMRIDQLTKAHEARIIKKRAQLRTLNAQHKQYSDELIEMQRILKELTELYMEKRKECQAEQSMLIAKGVPYTDRLPKRLAHSRQNSAGTDTFREAA